MKELSIEEKAKAYDIALDKINRLLGTGSSCSIEELEYVFPELVENEDERIRKEVISMSETLGRKDWIAWLEKQGEQKPNPCENCSIATNNCQKLPCTIRDGEQKFEQKFFINDKVVHKATGKIWTIHHYLKDTNSYYVEDNDGLLHHYRENELKLVEQKPAWSKEDENNILFLTSIIEECFKDKEKITLCGDTVCASFTKENVIDRLKSLRPQSPWKPSEKHIQWLIWVINRMPDTEKTNEAEAVLRDLLEQLNKLRKE